MGVTVTTDLDRWRRWQKGRDPLRALRARGKRTPPPMLTLHVRGDSPSILLAMDAATPSAVAAAVAPLAHLGDIPVAVLAPADVTDLLPGAWSTQTCHANAGAPVEARSLRAVIATGHFLPSGSTAFGWTEQTDARFLVVQHGLLTPFAPPLPRAAELLAFSAQDAAFWTEKRPDVATVVVGSQLLWAAAQKPRPPAVQKRPLFLGQLHGAELSRRTAAATATRFCLESGADYRPHPAEIDRRSRWQHAAWRRRGIRVVDGGDLLSEPRPVVSIFSTGVLEAAAAGMPAWVTCERPPRWVREFWDRYELSPWGGPSPTPAPSVPSIEPAASVAIRALAHVAGEAA